MSSRRFTTEFVITGDSTSAVQASRDLQRANNDLDQQVQRVQRSNEEMSQSFESVSSHAARLATVSAAATAAMGTMVLTQTRNIAEQASLARSVGVTVQTLQQWEFAAERVNLGAGKMGDIFKDVSEKIGDFVTTGGGEAADLFERLNLNINELMGMSPDRQLLAIGEALDDVATQGEKIFFMESLASDASRLLPLMENNAELLREQISLADQMGLSMPQSDIDSIELANQALNELNGLATGFANTVTANWSPAIVSASNNIQELVEYFGGMGEVVDFVTDGTIILTAVMGARLVGALEVATTKTLAKVAADRRLIQSEAAAAAAAARRTAAEKQAAMALLSTARLEAQATKGTAAHTFALQQLSAARTRATTAAGAHTAAMAASTSAASAATAAQSGLATATNAAKGAMALVGGPMGAAVLAGAAAYYFRDSLGFASAAAREATDEIDQLVESMDSYTEAQYRNNRVSIVQDLAEARIEAEKLEQQIAALQEQSQQESIIYQGRPGASGGQMPALMAELQEQNRIIEANEQGLKEYDQAWQDVLQSQISGVGIFRTLDQWLFDTGESAQEASARFDALNYTLGTGGQEWDDYIGKLQNARDVIGMTAAESAEYAAAQQGFTGLYAEQAGAVSGQTAALSDYRSAIQQGNDAEAAAHLERAQRYAEAEAMVLAQLANVGTLTDLLKGVQTELSATALSAALVVGGGAENVNALLAESLRVINERAAAIQSTTVVTAKNTAANREAEKAAREAEQAAEAQAKALVGIQQEMEPLLKDHETYIERMGVLDKALAEGTISEEAYAEAVRWAAEQYTRAATGAEEYEKQTQSLVDKYDSHTQKAKALRDELEQINQRYAEGEIGAQQYARMIDGVRDSQYELALETNDLAQIFDDFIENTGERLDDAGVDFFKGLITGAGNAMDQLEDLLIDGVSEIANALLFRPVTVQITGELQGLLGQQLTGSAGGQQSGGLGLSSMSSLKSGWETVSGWWGGGSTASTAGGVYANAATNGYAGGWAGNATSSGATIGGGASAYGAPSWAGGGTASGLAGGLYTAGAGFAGGWAGNQVFGGGGDSDTGAAIGTAAGAAIGSVIPVIGTYFGAAIGSFLGSGIGSMFGNETEFKGRFGTTGTNDPSQYARSGKDGVFEHQDDGTNFYGQSALGYTGFLDSGTERLQRAGIGEDKGWAEELTAASVEMDNLVASIASSPEELEAMRAAVQGLETSSSNAGQIIEFALNERPRAALEALGGDFGAFVRILDGGIEQVVAQAQVAQQAHTLLTDSAERLGLQFNIAGGYAYEAATEVAQLAGGVENLSSLQQSYYQNYFSDAERAAHLTEDLTETLNSMGLQMPETREGFRALIESQELATQAGRENYTQLLQLESAFAQLTPAIEETGSAAIDASGALREREQLERQLLQLQGDTAELRRRDLLDIDESNRALQQRIWSIQDERAAQEEAERAQQERIRAIEQESQAWARARDQLAGFSNSIDGWLAQLDGTEKGMGTPRERLEASDADFWAQYEKALQGDRNAQQGITQSADRYIANLQEMYASSDPAVDGIAEIRDAMERLPELLTPEQFLADEFKGALSEQTTSQVSALDLNGDGTISAIERSITAEWDATQQLNGVLSREMERLGTTVLTESQIRSALKPHATDAEITRLINNVDKNGDGIISRQELTNARLSDLAGGIASAVAGQFGSIDISANDLIDYDEFRRAFAGMATDGELRRIFNKLDVDGNGQISRLEAINANTSTIDQANGDGLKVSFGRNHNPSGLIDMAYNWGTKWGQMGAPAFRGAGGGDLDYEPPGEGSSGSGSSGSGSGGGGSTGGSPSGGSGSSGIPAGAQSWIDQAIRYDKSVDGSVDNIISTYDKGWWKKGTASYFMGEALSELSRMGATLPSEAENISSWRFFADGGYTGPGGKYDPAGIVHAGEVVWSQDDIARAGGVGAVESMRIGGISAPPLPKIQMQLPMPEMPPLPQFPALGNNDVLQVLNDVRKELQETRKENKRLLELIGDNTGDTVEAIEEAAARSEQLGADQLEELETISRASRTEKHTT